MCEYLKGPFAGYRVAGNYLVSPDGQRITRARLEGLMWRDHTELLRAGYASRRKAETAKKRFGSGEVKVVIIPLADWHAKHFGTIAG